jgi:hypothetical protein
MSLLMRLDRMLEAGRDDCRGDRVRVRARRRDFALVIAVRIAALALRQAQVVEFGLGEISYRMTVSV